tara:strand:+ start:1079 stop:1867 length:789 start_codon:yes stop_codon:yes gene_type:complete
MKLTKEVLKKIINEEIEKSINEGFFDSVKRAFGSDKYVPIPWHDVGAMEHILGSPDGTVGTIDGKIMPADIPSVKKIRAILKMAGEKTIDQLGDQMYFERPFYALGDAEAARHFRNRDDADPVKDLLSAWDDSSQAKSLEQEMKNLTWKAKELSAEQVLKLNNQVLDAFKDWALSHVDNLVGQFESNQKLRRYIEKEKKEKERKEREERQKASDAALGASNCKEVKEKCRQRHYTKDYYRAAPAHQRTVERNYEDCVKENGC